MLKRILILLFFSLSFYGLSSQGLTIDELCTYLDPNNFQNDSILLKKGFRPHSLKVISAQEIMYLYKNENEDESIYYGGIEQDKPYRQFHISLFYSEDSLRHRYILDYLNGHSTYRGKGWSGYDDFVTDSLEYRLYSNNQLRIFSEKKYPLKEKPYLSIRVNYIDSLNQISDPTNRFEISKFDENGLAVSKGIMPSSYGLINKEGEFVVLPLYLSVKYLNGAYRVAKYDPKRGQDPQTREAYIIYGLLNKEGKEMAPVIYDKIIEDSNGKYLLIKGEETKTIGF